MSENLSWKIDSERRSSALAMLFRVLAVLEFVGGAILCFLFWPNVPNSDLGVAASSAIYIVPFTWLSIGFISGAFFLAIAEVIIYLKSIHWELASARLTKLAVASESKPISIA